MREFKKMIRELNSELRKRAREVEQGIVFQPGSLLKASTTGVINSHSAVKFTTITRKADGSAPNKRAKRGP